MKFCFLVPSVLSHCTLNFTFGRLLCIIQSQIIRAINNKQIIFQWSVRVQFAQRNNLSDIVWSGEISNAWRVLTSCILRFCCCCSSSVGTEGVTGRLRVVRALGLAPRPETRAGSDGTLREDAHLARTDTTGNIIFMDNALDWYYNQLACRITVVITHGWLMLYKYLLKLFTTYAPLEFETCECSINTSKHFVQEKVFSITLHISSVMWEFTNISIIILNLNAILDIEQLWSQQPLKLSKIFVFSVCCFYLVSFTKTVAFIGYKWPI